MQQSKWNLIQDFHLILMNACVCDRCHVRRSNAVRRFDLFHDVVDDCHFDQLPDQGAVSGSDSGTRSTDHAQKAEHDEHHLNAEVDPDVPEGKISVSVNDQFRVKRK